MKSLFLVLAGICLCAFLQAQVVFTPYLGVSAANFLTIGSFDGDSYFETDEDIILVPKIRPCSGAGIIAGLKGDLGAFELSYYYTRGIYTTMETGYSGMCTQHMVRWLGLTHFSAGSRDKKLKPYIDMELSVMFSNFEKAAYAIGMPEYPNSASYSGLLFGVGGGFQWFLGKNLALDLRVLPEYYMGTDLKAKGSDRYSITKFANLMVQSTCGIKYYFITNTL